MTRARRLRTAAAGSLVALFLSAGMSTAAWADRGSLSSRAVTLLLDVVHGRDRAVVATFNARMRSALSATRLAKDWAAYQLVFGHYVGHGQPTTATIGPLTVVRIPLRMGRRRGEFRITFQADGRVAGLYLLRAGVPL